MYFYRYLHPLRALTFDLDDTLYDNTVVLTRTEQESIIFLQKYHPALQGIKWEEYQNLRNKLLASEPEIYHDVTYLRWRSIELIMRNAGLSESKARAGANATMDIVTYWRNKINVPSTTHHTLAALSNRWPLAAITNGNVDPTACGLAGYFSHILRAGRDGRAKPFKDMYHTAARLLQLPLRNILHVGDDLEADINGAIRCGIQACWINDSGINIQHSTHARLLPHIEITRLSSLELFL
ncbi:5-amino-6-(5-phospho-D-ribitylamino)uracil phosphatase YigB [Candidatus Palibaumannia cicadellinicola]|uniref:Haloacid dehalogenase-like hydrolase n=1 Tax=Baumannia cicadellinicola subsp. Homalodisca coagulata TaxID=374463 RepID=Q1LTW9_BAUCH|nr:5-amino-6-(5-phospho-D-ribitylamino)uracil phosphatase YigB [Candidatus Baumannia cicadellinicola]ABF14268.1 haloacid dehalogenase-like hydrolase [Baumannia cicadellinicola str. Hc (Homalodisca coagulata)]MCJ7462422.1 5-amino-6-(5-phospho-D-ribitylamino)uracil phosphatase YigB [Candidatus Baumannia cicadellinicola]MCJ7463046.1 5-amino-6-(5-phospho-D-ribitylamino)uracil phosphatase YigB [Candidatus Baumannia cicadellinicola]